MSKYGFGTTRGVGAAWATVAKAPAAASRQKATLLSEFIDLNIARTISPQKYLPVT
jgi:hypothetical protein